jgi:lipopolysaccharide/colanic/teichoic acid biosynthesis glycosyltransferase
VSLATAAVAYQELTSPLVEAVPASRRNDSLVAKRTLDVVVAVAALIVLAPLFLMIAIAIKLDSAGPVFFSHERVGSRRRGSRWVIETFQFRKFRSMAHGADPTIHEAHVRAYVGGILQPKANGFKLEDDDRITRVGRFLRRTSLDELPQLINVVLGEMSLVGPRPLPPYEVALHDQWHLERLAALPGITGPWQVSGRCVLDFEEMVRLDIEYVRCRTFATDIALLFKTIPAVFTLRGAG